MLDPLVKTATEMILLDHLVGEDRDRLIRGELVIAVATEVQRVPGHRELHPEIPPGGPNLAATPING